jgi:hypothetical protein
MCRGDRRVLSVKEANRSLLVRPERPCGHAVDFDFVVIVRKSLARGSGAVDRVGDKDQAFAWLQKAYDERDDRLMFLKVDLYRDNLRSDPRYTNLVR